MSRGISGEEDPGLDLPPPDLAWTDDLVGVYLAQSPDSDTSVAAALMAALAQRV